MTELPAQIHEVDPARLASGSWCHRAQKTLGEGDISASYNADRIAMDKPLRKPFQWRGASWISVGNGNCRGQPASSEAYRFAHPSTFSGTPVTYAAKVRDADAARADPNGFYHGMTVKHAGTIFVLCGPPVLFVAGKTEQLSLF